MPDLTFATPGQEGAPAPAQERNEAGFVMKEMAQVYIDKEKNAQSISTRVDGKSTEVREKEWKRADMDKAREKRGQAPMTDREWKTSLAPPST